MTIEEMKIRKRELHYSNKRIAELAGLSQGAVQMLLSGDTKHPRKKTLEAVERVLRDEDTNSRPGRVKCTADNTEGSIAYPPADGMSGILAESSAAYAAAPKGFYTIDDYLLLAEEEKTELIDGTFYEQDPPDRLHRAVLAQLFLQFASCVDQMRAEGKVCEVLYAPVRLQPDASLTTLLHPDLILFFNREDYRPDWFQGAPELVVEIVSNASRNRDMTLKFHKYRESGVRELWYVDPEQFVVTVFSFGRIRRTEEERRYTFRDQVPVLVSDGSCRIDFRKIPDFLILLKRRDALPGAGRRRILTAL